MKAICCWIAAALFTAAWTAGAPVFGRVHEVRSDLTLELGGGRIIRPPASSSAQEGRMRRRFRFRAACKRSLDVKLLRKGGWFTLEGFERLVVSRGVRYRVHRIDGGWSHHRTADGTGAGERLTPRGVELPRASRVLVYLNAVRGACLHAEGSGSVRGPSREMDVECSVDGAPPVRYRIRPRSEEGRKAARNGAAVPSYFRDETDDLRNYFHRDAGGVFSGY